MESKINADGSATVRVKADEIRAFATNVASVIVEMGDGTEKRYFIRVFEPIDDNGYAFLETPDAKLGGPAKSGESLQAIAIDYSKRHQGHV